MRYVWFLSVLALAACDVGDTVSSITSGVVGTTIDASKGMAEGFKTGVQEGRKDARSVDGSTVLTTAAEVAGATTLWVEEVVPAGDGHVEVVLGIENLTASPLRLIGLTNEGGAVVIDADGFATPLAAPAEAIGVPPQARVRASLRFEGDAEETATVRVWGQDLAVPVDR